MPEQPEEQQPTGVPAININLTEKGMIISQVLAAFDENMMHQIVVRWLETHPALLAEIAKQEAEAKCNEIQVIRHINAKRND